MLEARQIFQRVALQHGLDHVAQVLAQAGLSAVVLKGGWLMEDVYPEAATRLVTDVDLLVDPVDWETLYQALAGAGWSTRSRDARQVTMVHPELALPLDIHQALFPPATFRLPAADVLARSVPSPRDGLRWPAPEDGFCHLLGHFSNDRAVASGLARGSDFQRVVERYSLRPDSLAVAVETAGMARAAAYVLPLVAGAAQGDGRWATAILENLPSDTVGRGIAALCRFALPRVGQRRLAGAALTCLLQPTLVAALASARGRLSSDLAARPRGGAARR